jgi:hypothetical protein
MHIANHHHLIEQIQVLSLEQQVLLVN